MHNTAASWEQNGCLQVEKEHLNIKFVQISKDSVILSSRYTVRLKGQVRSSTSLSPDCGHNPPPQSGCFLHILWESCQSLFSWTLYLNLWGDNGQRQNTCELTASNYGRLIFFLCPFLCVPSFLVYA